ncbi:MAG: hypothetical protein J7577_12165 [Sphingobacteriaceae bacterium]|nr:hypothetical protein [Sphingobacteriaceae bacterium]
MFTVAAQLSVFEVAIIISLSSAAGDPMLDTEFVILPSLLVFDVILTIYRLITYLTFTSQQIENILEGKPTYIVEDGIFTLKEQGMQILLKMNSLLRCERRTSNILGKFRPLF